MISRTNWLALLCGVSSLAIGGGAAAQQTQVQDPGVSSGDEVIVTARRREEALQDVPMAVSAVSGDALEASGAQDITALAQSIPNLTLENSRATNSTITAFIRGVGQQDPVAGFEQGVGIYLDDVYLNRPQGALLDIYDVERIEVLRGPQGTLYGRNTIGGAVKYVTRRLDPDAAALRARVAYGSYNQLETVVAGSIPLSPNFRVGGTVAALTRDGFGTNRTTGAENYNKDVTAGRVSVEFEPNSDFLVRFSVDHTEDNSAPRHGHRLLPTISGAQPTPLAGDYDTAAGIALTAPVHADLSATGAQLLVDWSPNDNWTFRAISAYREDQSHALIDFDSTAPRSFDGLIDYRNDQTSQKLQVLYGGDRINAILGVYYMKANAFNAFDVVFTSATSFTLGDIDTETWAVFGELTYDLTDALSLTLGGRYTEDERSAHIARQTYLGVYSPYFGNASATNITPTVTAGGREVVPNFRGVRQDDAFTPRVILAWEVDPNLNLYASYSQGFKGGSFDPRGNFANADVRQGFLPEFVDSYEVGAKARLFNGRATANTSVFFADYTDVQIPGSVVIPGPPVSFVGSTTNAGAAELKGIEFEGSAILTDHLSADVSFGYIDAKYTQFLVSGVDVSAKRAIQNTPEVSGSGSLTYQTPLRIGSSDGTIAFTGSGAYRGDTQQFETAIPLLDQPAFWLFDASINWKSENGRWLLALNGKNLADERYITSGYNFPGAATDNSVLAFYGNPQTVTASVQVRF